MNRVLFAVDEFNEVEPYSFDETETFPYNGRRVKSWTDIVDTETCITAVLDNGPSTKNLVLYKNEEFARLVGVERKYLALKESILALMK